MTTRVIIPWRGGCSRREANLRRVVSWWEQHHPEWALTVGEYPEEAGGWRKGMAVLAAGLPVAVADVVIVSDADVICEQVELAVEVVSGKRRHRGTPTQPLWAMPHRDVYRLNESATQMVCDGTWWPAQVTTTRELRPYVARSYAGFAGGGLVVLRGQLFNEVPMDPRFVGWGQEDHSWALALSMLGGAPWRGHGVLWHLWHPQAARLYPGVGSDAGLHLWQRYRAASTPPEMLSLIGEARQEIRRLRQQECHTGRG